MNLKTLIIDDEPLAHEVILEYAKDVPFLEIHGQCYLATEALSILNDQDIDLIFLDINMPKIKGLEFLKILDKKPLVIITSAYEEYALESFELDVCDYLLKPFRFERFLKASNKAYEIFNMKNQNLTDSPKTITDKEQNSSNQIFVKVDKKHIQIDINQIYYLESYGNYVKIWGTENYQLTPRTLSSFEEQLPKELFFRIHKSFIINKRFIDYLEGNLVIMKNNKQLPIGKNHKQVFKKFLG